MRIAVFFKIMKEKLKGILKSKRILAAAVLSLIWLIFYFALGAAIFKNMWYTSPAIPIVGGVAAFLPLCLELLNIFLFHRKWLDIVIICICPALGFSHFVFFAFVLSKLVYFFSAGLPYFIVLGLLLLIGFFVFAFPRLTKLWKRITAIFISAILLVICLTSLFNFTPFYVDGGATVFITDSEYQIAFSTSHPSTGEIEVNGKAYFDASLGENNISKLHKISVPKGELESAKGYVIRTKSVAINTAYLPSAGRTIEKTYSFRPINENDGLQIYNLSDTHECLSGPAAAASYFGDKLDLLILNGDIINDVSTEYQISLIYKLAHKITGGGIPVLYTRGNHECNGKLASRLGEYVGCGDKGFYFNLKLGSLSLLVLDTANDMADDNALISPIANFDPLRREESEWIKGLGNWNDREYNLVIAHMAYPLSGYLREKCPWHEWAKELVALTSGKTQLAICGHSHKTDFATAGSSDNMLADFPVLRGSIRSDKYPDKEGVSPFEFTGTAIELKDRKIIMKFTNSDKKVLGEHTMEI